MTNERMGVTPFTSEEIGAAKNFAPRKQFSYSKSSYNGRRSGYGARRKQVRAFSQRDKQKAARRVPISTVVKVGICVFACAMVFTMKALDIPAAAEMVSGVRVAVNEESDMTEILGKLQFVEIPDVLAVFSSGSKMAVPVIAPYVSVNEETNYAEWDGAPNAQVVAAAAGEVRAIGEDTVLGQYVRIAHAGELETIYYGLETVNVEQGQPIRKQDTLGALGEEGTLRVCFLLSGAPQPPETYLNIVQ
ncbi:M23 family metallopeptidase [Eubacteriales bacterium OttesenSCG-928-K08]|nr:M23 family metallopeptidase [Eubacteriales bacterium OttesenSCG-928-K08]